MAGEEMSEDEMREVIRKALEVYNKSEKQEEQ